MQRFKTTVSLLLVILSSSLFFADTLTGQSSSLQKSVDHELSKIESQLIEWRRHFHEFPELSNREFETAKKIASILKEFKNLQVDEGIAITGVVGVLDTGKPGPTIGLRADIDGLPVVERADLPFKSTQRTTYLGKEVGIMHACGHDTHIAMLLATAKVLTEVQDELTGKFVFVFQPAEEGAPIGEEGGAALMVKEGIIERYGIEVFFGQHISSGLDAGIIRYKPGGIMAASDQFEIDIMGKQTHGSRPWSGIDPITVASHMVLGLQNIISRETELTKEAAVISVGKIEGGVRNNIIPESVKMIGTIRTLDTAMQRIIHQKMQRKVKGIADAYGAEAKLTINIGYPVTHNDIELTKKMIPSLYKAIGEQNVRITPAVTGAEDFSFFAKEVPGLYYFVGGKSVETPYGQAYPHHTPDFYIDESGMMTGVKALTQLSIDYMNLK